MLSTAGSYKQAGAPNIYGTFSLLDGTSFNEGSGAISMRKIADNNAVAQQSGEKAWEVILDASIVSHVYGSANTIQPASLICQYLIKY